MTRDDRLADLFDRAVALGPESRDSFLAAECGSDTELLAELRGLLAADLAATTNQAWDRSALCNAAQEEATGPDSGIGEALGPYRIVEMIGTGGMGKVYRAVRADSHYDKSVAIKRIKRGLDADRIVARLRSERQILSNLEHDNIARLLDGGTSADGLPYLVMEYVEGKQPGAYCDEHGLSLKQRLILFRQICSAVHYAHQRMVIHRDLKPGNIMVTSEGVPKLLDFGIAKVFGPDTAFSAQPNTETATLPMTARYASPEQVRGERVTTATDIYSLGVILYELLTDHSPYRDPERPAHELMRSVCEDEPGKPSIWRPELRGDLDNIIFKALRKNPAERYASVHGLSDDIQRFLDGRPVVARGEGIAYVATKFIRRNKVAVVSAVMVICALVAGVVATARARARAERRFNQVRQLAHAVVFDYHDAIEQLPGSTPVRERLVRDALKYLDSLTSDADDVGLERELVDSYVRISRVQGDSNYNNLGDTVGAIQSAAKAVGAAEKMLARDRGAGTLGSAAAAFLTQGSLMHSSGDLAGAERSLRRGIELRQEAARLLPDNLDALLALSASWRALADLYGGSGMQNLGRSNLALELYRRSAKLSESLALNHPKEIRPLEDRRDGRLTLAGLEADLGRSADTERELAEALKLGEEVIRREPSNTTEQLELANACLRSGLHLLDNSKPAVALAPMKRAEAILENLLSADPRNALYQRDLSVTESHLASALRATGQMTEALVHNRRSLALAGALSQSDPKSVEYRADKGISHRKLAETLLAAGLAKAAVEEATRAVSVLCEIAASSHDSYLQTHCVRARLANGEAQIKAGDWSGAADSYRTARELAAGVSAADPGNTVVRADLARAESGLGAVCRHQGDGARALAWYGRSASQWAEIRTKNALTSGDSARAEETNRVLVHLLKQYRRN